MNRVTLTCGLALMDVCWLYPWSALLGLWAEPNAGRALLSAPVTLALLLLAAIATHLLGRRARAHPRSARIALALLAVLSATLAVRVEHYPNAEGLDWIGPLIGALAAMLGQFTLPVLGFALGLYVWWRGVRLGSQTPGFSEVEGAFRWGIARLAVFGLVIALTTRASVLPTVEGRTTPYVVTFFFVSLLTLALGRLESLRTRTRRPSLNPQWLGVLIVVAAGVVLLALLLGQLISFDLLLVATRPLFDLLGQIILLLLYAIVIPLSFVIEWIVFLVLSLLRFNGNQPPPQPPQPADVDNILQRFFAEQVPPELLVALKATGAALLVLIALVVVARSLARWRPSGADADATNEERDSLWNARSMRARLLAWLRRLFQREHPEPANVSDAVAAGDARLPAPLLASVRALYAELLRRGEAAGVPRGASTTPLEHVPALTRTMTPEAVVENLTSAYLRARYGDLDIPQAQTSELAAELERVQPKSAGQ